MLNALFIVRHSGFIISHMLVLRRQEVEALLDLDGLVDSLAQVMAELSAGSVSMPARVAAEVREQQAGPERSDRGLLAVMPVYLSSSQTLSSKLVSVFPESSRRGLPSHQAVIVVFDSATGAPLAIMDGTYITAARTAAGSALATRMLARPDADVLVILGTGVQARAHARAIPRVRRMREVRVAGRDPSKARALAAELAAEIGVAVEGWEFSPEVLARAGVICAATHSPEPVVKGEWLEPGVHVNSVGLNLQGREVDGEAVRKALVVVESRRAALAPPPAGANDLRWPIRDGLVTEAHIHAELGELVRGTRPGRTHPDQITLYTSVGVAVQDAAAA
jgi:ornithine cyclodeaminase/alanine dehydrogenase-like protein (mu-crystallin family)